MGNKWHPNLQIIVYKDTLLNFVHCPVSLYEDHNNSGLSATATFRQTGYGEIPILLGPYNNNNSNNI
jgi:hypothetical protein